MVRPPPPPQKKKKKKKKKKKHYKPMSSGGPDNGETMHIHKPFKGQTKLQNKCTLHTHFLVLYSKQIIPSLFFSLFSQAR